MGGRNRKRFIDKKNAATFQLLPRDTTAAAAADPSDRVFVRVDANPHYFDDSVFADAAGDNDGEACPGRDNPGFVGGGLPCHVQREILDLGLSDDGYNYLSHLREISYAGAGSHFLGNPKADSFHNDFKAYDASKLSVDRKNLTIKDVKDVPLPSSRVPAVKIPPKALDSDILNLLDDELSKSGSDFEDDFVVQAGEYLEEAVDLDGSLSEGGNKEDDSCEGQHAIEEVDVIPNYCHEPNMLLGAQNPRAPRPLDELFDQFMLQEYGSSNEEENIRCSDGEQESFTVKLNDVLKNHPVDDLELEGKYKVPGDFVNGIHNSSSAAQVNASLDVIRRCREYAEKYEEEAQVDQEGILFEESSDESESWDCETIVSTYSTLDNHPGKIEAPSSLKNRVHKTSEGSAANNNIIILRGKEKLPVDFLPNRGKPEKLKKAPTVVDTSQMQSYHSQESKEDKKARKAAVKDERRKARKEKKDLKNFYSCATQRAQKAAASTGPSSIHIM